LTSTLSSKRNIEALALGVVVAETDVAARPAVQFVTVDVELTGVNAANTSLSMDGSSWLKLNFGDKVSAFQIDKDATITNMVLAGDPGGNFLINGGTTEIAQSSSYKDTIGVQFQVLAGATLRDEGWTQLKFTNNYLDITIAGGEMLVFFGTGNGAPLIDSNGFSNDGINITSSGLLKYLGSGNVTDTFTVPILVQDGGELWLTNAGNAPNGGKLIVKGAETVTHNASVYMTGDSTIQLSQASTLECDNDYYQDAGTLLSPA
jgi:hypothetical protein